MNIPRRSSLRTAAVSLAAVAALVAAGMSPAAARNSGAPSAGATTLTESALEGEHGVSPDATVRDVLTVTDAATRIRVRLSNPFGADPVDIEAASIGIAVSPGSPAISPGTSHVATFAGAHSIELAPGQSVWSDPVPVRVRPFDQVSVSIYAPNSPIDDHTFPPPQAFTPGSFLSTTGDATADQSGGSYGLFRPGVLWWADAISGVSPDRGTIVTLGDSITDGYHADGGGPRWADVLARRIDQLPPGQRLSVANAGISGNTVSEQPNPYDPTGQCCGPPALDRLDRDVLSLPGVKDVLLLEGTNDIGGGANAPSASTDQVIGAMQQIADRVHAAGKRIIGATILPMCDAAGSQQEATRLAVNHWIRTSGTFDAVLDFDAVLRDPSDPTVMRAEWRYDCYHPNATGDRLLGDSVPLAAFGLDSTARSQN